MISVRDFEEYGKLFEDEDFSMAALCFFLSTYHTDDTAQLQQIDDMSYFVYSCLDEDVHLNAEERSVLKRSQKLCKLSFLFAINDKLFAKSSGHSIEYYSVDLSVPRSERSQFAYTIHSILSKTSYNNHVVVIFRSDDMIMLSASFCRDSHDRLIYQSDWIDFDHDIAFVDDLMVYNYSFSSSYSFIMDFAYAIARNYYTHPVSYDYAFGAINDIGLFGTSDYMDWKEFNEAIYQDVTSHIRKYCDDYVECFKSVYDRVFINDEEIDFNALELDLEKLSHEDAIDDNQFDDGNTESILGDIDISEIDDEILKDPVALYEWLEKHEM